MGPYLAGLMLGCRYGFFSQIIYILLGVLGIPVFAGFTSGAGVIAGPTGGFIAGYIMCAVICGLPARKKGSSYRILLMICGLIACYALGLAWFMILTHSTLWAGLVACVHSVSAGRRCKDSSCGRIVKISRQSLPFSVKAA